MPLDETVWAPSLKRYVLANNGAHYCRAQDLSFGALDTVGDGTGTKDILGDYSAAQQIFRRKAPSDRIVLINRMSVRIGDNQNLTADSYGSGNALTNGISMAILDPSDQVVVEIIPTADPVKTNADWDSLATQLRPVDWGSGINYVTALWEAPDGGVPIVIEPGYSLAATVNDNFTGLLLHRITASGHQVTI